MPQYVAVHRRAGGAGRGRARHRRSSSTGVRLSLDTGDVANLAYFLDSLVVVESLAADHHRALVLHGAATRLRETVGSNVYGYYKPDEEMLASALERARLAVGENAATAVAEGHALAASTEATVDFALRVR